MTEAEWLTLKVPIAMLECLGMKASERKLRLFGILCCQQNDDLFRRDRRLLEAIALAERYIEGVVTESERVTAEKQVYAACDRLKFDELDWYLGEPARLLGTSFSVGDAESCAFLTSVLAETDERGFPDQEKELDAELADFMRDIFGNPFRPVAVDPRWLTSTAVGLARAIYDERAFDRLPILADALQDAGCEDEAILAHCRGDGPHVRGCWVVDLILGKQ